MARVRRKIPVGEPIKKESCFNESFCISHLKSFKQDCESDITPDHCVKYPLGIFSGDLASFISLNELPKNLSKPVIFLYQKHLV
jgi:hypothetical protein